MERLSEETVVSKKTISKQIKELFLGGKTEEAISLAQTHYKDNIVIRAQLIKIYTITKQFNKAYKLLRGYTNISIIKEQANFLFDEQEKEYERKYQELINKIPSLTNNQIMKELENQPIENVHRLLKYYQESNNKDALKVARRFKYYPPIRNELVGLLIERKSFSELVELSTIYKGIERKLDELSKEENYASSITTARKKQEDRILKKTEKNN